MILWRVYKLGHEIGGFVDLWWFVKCYDSPDFVKCVFFKACLGFVYFWVAVFTPKTEGIPEWFFPYFSSFPMKQKWLKLHIFWDDASSGAPSHRLAAQQGPGLATPILRPGPEIRSGWYPLFCWCSSYVPWCSCVWQFNLEDCHIASGKDVFLENFPWFRTVKFAGFMRWKSFIVHDDCIAGWMNMEGQKQSLF